jgi:amino acid efflux transporter
MAYLSPRGIPTVAVVVVAAVAGGGLLLAYARGWGAEAFLVVPNSLVIVVYVVGLAAGVRLLTRSARIVAGIGAALCTAIVPFAGVSVLLPAGVACAAVLYLRTRRHRTLV